MTNCKAHALIHVGSTFAIFKNSEVGEGLGGVAYEDRPPPPGGGFGFRGTLHRPPSLFFLTSLPISEAGATAAHICTLPTHMNTSW